MNIESWEGEERKERGKVMMAPERKHDEDNWEGRDRKRRGNEKLRQKEGGLRLGNKERRRRKGRRRRRVGGSDRESRLKRGSCGGCGGG